MTAARLEELARIAEEITTDGYDPSLNGDLLDLARCARGWATIGEAENPSLERWDWPQGTKWYFRATGLRPSSATTALEAVEAAEVKP